MESRFACWPEINWKFHFLNCQTCRRTCVASRFTRCKILADLSPLTLLRRKIARYKAELNEPRKKKKNTMILREIWKPLWYLRIFSKKKKGKKNEKQEIDRSRAQNEYRPCANNEVQRRNNGSIREKKKRRRRRRRKNAIGWSNSMTFFF